MALVVKDRVQEITGTTGTGTVTLGGAVLGYQTFATVGNGNTTYYTIVDLTAGDWEVGIGTYNSATPSLSRDTVLSSSNAGSLVSFGTGTKNVFVTYPSSRSVYKDSADVYTVQQAFDALTANSIALTSGTISTTPTSNTDIVNKQYADAIASGIHFHEAVDLATTTALPANTYNNGASGVGATLTATANGALSVDSTLTVASNRILVKNEATQANNGVYTVTQVGSAGTPYILTRATDFDTVGTGVDQIDEGDFFLVTSGTVNLNTAWVQQTAPPITVGTTAIVFQQFSAPITYTAGTGLNESPTYTFNIANTGVGAATYGSASSVPVVAVNAQGQITSATDTAIAIAAGAVSGLAASATTDTTNANNITSGSLGTSRLSGSYTGITGTGALAAGSLATGFTAVTAPLGGTGLTSYAVGDLLYADTTTSLAKLADVAVGNALISGGVGAAPSWGKIGLTTHVSGTLPIANGGTGTTSTTFVNLATNVTGILPSANGGTGNGFTKFSGATTAEKTYTLPNATCSILTSNAAVTVAQGGTGLTSTPSNGQVDIGNGTGFTRATLTQGTGITITNAAGSITIASSVTSPIPSGTVMIFKQTAAPTGWTKDTTVGLNDSALRIVTGTVSTGGTVAFSTAFASQSVAGTLSSTTATNQNTTATGSVSSPASSGLTTATNQATTAGGSVSSSSSSGLTTATNQATTAGGSISGSVGTSGATTLGTGEIPAHAHTLSNNAVGPGAGPVPVFYRTGYGNSSTDNTGGGGSHSHGGGSFSGSFSGSSHNHTQDAHNHSISTSSSFTGSSHNHTQDAHNHTITVTSTLTMNAHTHTQDAHTHTFTGTAINLAVKYIDFIIASKD